MSDDFRDLRDRRLPNWGRYARLDPCKPDSSCANPLYEQYLPDGDEDGWGEVTTATIRAITTAPPPAEQDEIDEHDAEIVDAWIRQTPMPHRAVLIGRYALRLRFSWLDTDAAIRALLDAIRANREAVAEMHRRLR